MSVDTPSPGFIKHLRWKHGLSPEDVEPSEVPGNWVLKEPCPGGDECRHMMRMVTGPCRGGRQLTLRYAPRGRDKKGRFLSPYEEWYRQTGRREADE